MIEPDNTLVSGVYFLFRDETLIYVGKSNDTQKRVRNHRQNGRPFDVAIIAPVPHSVLSMVERALIRALKPPENKALNDDKKIETPIYVSTPPPAPEMATPPPPARPVMAQENARLGVSEPQERQDGLITLSVARTMASSFGVKAAFEAAVETGEVKFVVTKERRSPKAKNGISQTRVGRYEPVVAWIKEAHRKAIESLGL